MWRANNYFAGEGVDSSAAYSESIAGLPLRQPTPYLNSAGFHAQPHTQGTSTLVHRSCKAENCLGRLDPE